MKVLLCIVDGLGICEKPDAQIDFIQENLHRGVLLNASEEAVGLMSGQMGNSEVGHITIGAGRIVPQNLLQITNSIQQNTFPSLPQHNTYHLIGLLSDGGVHSHIDHLIHILKILSHKRVFIHIISDGRDTGPQTLQQYITVLEPYLNHSCAIATICGRYYGMDRDNRLDRTELAYETIALGKSTNHFTSIQEYISQSYDKGISDEFILPACDFSYNGFLEDDAILFFNFRSDRMRQIVRTIFSRHSHNVLISMVDYFDNQLHGIHTLFAKQQIHNALGEILSKHNKKQLRIAETEKYAHVTFFLSCGREEPYNNEDRILIPSPKVATYDLQPEMSAYEITNEVIQVLQQQQYDFICVNFANADMVGHTGKISAAMKACEVLNNCLSKISDVAAKEEYVMLITSDHGNIEQMTQNNQPHKAHTLNKVPLICMNDNVKIMPYNGELGLQDIAPTVLHLMNLPIPFEMSGGVLMTIK